MSISELEREINFTIPRWISKIKLAPRTDTWFRFPWKKQRIGRIDKSLYEKVVERSSSLSRTWHRHLLHSMDVWMWGKAAGGYDFIALLCVCVCVFILFVIIQTNNKGVDTFWKNRYILDIRTCYMDQVAQNRDGQTTALLIANIDHFRFYRDLNSNVRKERNKNSQTHLWQANTPQQS